MNLAIKLIIFAIIVISVNNFVLFYAIKNIGKHSRIHSVGMLIFLISLIELVAIGIFAYIHLR